MLGWAETFLIIALIAAVRRVWLQDRRSFSGDREDLVLYIPGDVRDLLCFWLERQEQDHNRRATVSSLAGRDYFSRGLSYATCAA